MFNYAVPYLYINSTNFKTSDLDLVIFISNGSRVKSLHYKIREVQNCDIKLVEDTLEKFSDRFGTLNLSPVFIIKKFVKNNIINLSGEDYEVNLRRVPFSVTSTPMGYLFNARYNDRDVHQSKVMKLQDLYKIGAI